MEKHIRSFDNETDIPINIQIALTGPGSQGLLGRATYAVCKHRADINSLVNNVT